MTSQPEAETKTQFFARLTAAIVADPNDQTVARRFGISRSTVRRHKHALRGAGIIPKVSLDPITAREFVTRIRARHSEVRVIFMISGSHSSFIATYADIERATGINEYTVKRLARRLRETEWLLVKQYHGGKPTSAKTSGARRSTSTSSSA